MKINSLTAADLNKFATVSQPTVKTSIAAKFGTEGIEMLDELVKSVDKAMK